MRFVGGVLGVVLVGVVFLLVAPVVVWGSEFGVTSFSVVATNQDGSSDVGAGSHPFELMTSLTMNGPEVGAVLKEPGELLLQGDLKDTRVELPPGLVGNPVATPRCAYQVMVSGPNACPNDTAVGFVTISLRNDEGKRGVAGVIFASDPVYNLKPPPGVAAQLGFMFKGLVPVVLNVSVRTGGDYGLTIDTHNIIEIEPVYAVVAHVWGVPADSGHDPVRGSCLNEESAGGSFGDCPVSAPRVPFLVNPTSCGVPRTASVSVDSWEEPGVFRPPVAFVMPALSGCEKLDFSPSIEIAPDQTSASTPTGLNVDVHVPQESFVNAAGLVEANVKNTMVALPVGMQISPSAANGLLACSQAQLGLHDAEPATCPDASKIADVEVNTPALPEPLLGSVFLAQQGNLPGNGDNPFGSLTALYIVVEDKQAGVLVKLAGEVSPDPVTGQLITKFTETPQVPFTDFKLRFFGGPRAPVSTPAVCGAYTTETSIEPWSGTGAVTPSSSFQIASGPMGTVPGPVAVRSGVRGGND